LTTFKSQIPNPKQIRKVQIPNQEPLAHPRCSEKNAFAPHVQSLEKSWGNRGRFLARAWGPPRPGGLMVSNLEFVWDLGFGISPDHPSIRNKKSIGHTFADPFYKHLISLEIRVVNPLLWRLWDACVLDSNLFFWMGMPCLGFVRDGQ
jgi:hypothetical protein